MSERCEATTGWGIRCYYPALWSVLTTRDERVVCGVHVRKLRNAPDTLAVEPLDDEPAYSHNPNCGGTCGDTC